MLELRLLCCFPGAAKTYSRNHAAILNDQIAEKSDERMKQEQTQEQKPKVAKPTLLQEWRELWSKRKTTTSNAVQ